MEQIAKPAVRWHSILFWGSLAVASSCLLSAPFNKDKKPHWVFDEYGQTEFKNFVRYNFKQGERWFPYEVHSPAGQPPKVAVAPAQ